MDPIDFNSIYTQHYNKSFLFVKSYVHDDMEAEDIVSESLISLWQTLRREPVEYPLALLLKILKNKSLNLLKHKSVHLAAMDNISASMVRNIDYQIRSLEACDPQEVFSSEIKDIIEDTLQSLPELTRRIFIMSRYESLPVNDIASQLSMNPKSIEYHITKSLKALRISLKDYFPIILFF